MPPFSQDELQQKLQGYCNWASLPADLLLQSTSSMAAPQQHEQQQLAAFLRHLTTLVPSEWSVLQQAVFEAPNSSNQGATAGASSSSGSKRLHASMHAPGVGTAEGLMCFGGVQLGLLQEVKVENEVSWIKNSEPGGLAPDHSRVYQGTPSTTSRQVVRLGPSSAKPGAAWAAEPVSPALDAGLLGHSVVLYGQRAFIFGGLQDFTAKADDATVARRTTNRLWAYAVNEAGTQGGLLPLLSDVPQLGQAPGCRMYHSAAVDPEGGTMFVYGGVTLHTKNQSRVPAEGEAGLLHAFDFATYTWSTLRTSGDHMPRSTTLLAFFWHAGALWAVPDLPRTEPAGSSRKAGKALAAGYQLLRLCMDSKQWQLVQCQGEAPSQRMDACSVFNPLSQELVIYGGRQVQPPFALLADVHILSLTQQQQPQPQDQQQHQNKQQQKPVWQQVQPNRLHVQQPLQGVAAGGPHQHQQQHQQQHQGMLPLAGHAGGVVLGTGEVAFVGGYQRNDFKEPQPLLQVLTKAVKAPTPDAAKLAGRVSQQQLAMQHVRMQLARMVKKAHPAQVVLKAQGGGVRLPARLLALYSCLFDDLFQSMLEDDEDEQQDRAAAAAAAGQQQQQQQQPVQEVPVPGVQQASIAAVCRWMMGLLALQSCTVEVLVDMYRVADRLVMEQLMVDVLEELADRQLRPQEAALVMQLAGDFPVAGGAIHANAAQQLQQQVSPSTAPAIMALARQQSNSQALQDCCVEVMRGHVKNDVYSVLDFALKFNLRSLQGSCLGSLRRASRDRLVDKADRIMQVVSRRLLRGQDAARVPTVQMLERDLVNEVEGADLQSLPSYCAVCERLHLRVLYQGLLDVCSRDEVWQALHAPPCKNVLQHLQQRYARLYTAVMQQRGQGQRGGGSNLRAPQQAAATGGAAGVTDAAAVTNLLGNIATR